jgi:hypothetical protein
LKSWHHALFEGEGESVNSTPSLEALTNKKKLSSTTGLPSSSMPLEVVQGVPEYAAEGPVIGECPSFFSPDYATEEIYEIAAQLIKKGGISPLQPDDGLHSRFQGAQLTG